MSPPKITISESRRMRTLYGYCDEHSGDIVLRAGMRQFDDLGTTVHEGLHVALPTTTEEEIHRIARLVTWAVWLRGYRRKPKKS